MTGDVHRQCAKAGAANLESGRAAPGMAVVGVASLQQKTCRA